MSLVHLHLILNHVPVIGSLGVVLLLAWAVYRRSDELKRTALGAAVLVALVTPGAYFTGEPAEDAVKGLPGVLQPLIEQHEEAAELAFIAISILGVISLGVLLRWRSPAVQKHGIRVALVVSVLAFALVARAANLGGQVRHTEVRGDAAVGTGASGEHDD